MKKFANLTINGASVSISNMTTDLTAITDDKNILSVLKQHLPRLWEREMYDGDADLNRSDVAAAVNVVPDEYCVEMDNYLTVDGMEISNGWADVEYNLPKRERAIIVGRYDESSAFGGYSIHQGWIYNGTGYVPCFSASSRRGGWDIEIERCEEPGFLMAPPAEVKLDDIGLDTDGDGIVYCEHCGVWENIPGCAGILAAPAPAHKKRKIILVNSFSLNMLEDLACTIDISAPFKGLLCLDSFYNGGLCTLVNAIGHASTDALVRGIADLDGVTLPKGERMTVKLDGTELVLVAQYSGPRLEEGTTVLPEGAKVEFRWVSFNTTYIKPETTRSKEGSSCGYCDSENRECGPCHNAIRE